MALNPHTSRQLPQQPSAWLQAAPHKAMKLQRLGLGLPRAACGHSLACEVLIWPEPSGACVGMGHVITASC